MTPTPWGGLEGGNKALKEQCTEYTMKPILAFLEDMFAYVCDKSQLNAEFAYDAPSSTSRSSARAPSRPSACRCGT